MGLEEKPAAAREPTAKRVCPARVAIRRDRMVATAKADPDERHRLEPEAILPVLGRL